MPSKKKQINIRADDDTLRLLAAVIAAASADTGLSLSQSDVVRMAIHELAKKYKVKAKPDRK